MHLQDFFGKEVFDSGRPPRLGARVVRRKPSARGEPHRVIVVDGLSRIPVFGDREYATAVDELLFVQSGCPRMALEGDRPYEFTVFDRVPTHPFVDGRQLAELVEYVLWPLILESLESQALCEL